MKCHRCGSVMVYERFYYPEEHFSGWRCVLCGEIHRSGYPGEPPDKDGKTK